ncbi:45337_t:CDS:2, partial [Gigaspora margarita]
MHLELKKQNTGFTDLLQENGTIENIYFDPANSKYHSVHYNTKDYNKCAIHYEQLFDSTNLRYKIKGTIKKDSKNPSQLVTNCRCSFTSLNDLLCIWYTIECSSQRTFAHYGEGEEYEGRSSGNLNLGKVIDDFKESFNISNLYAVDRIVTTSDRAKSAFISLISYELRTSLHGILASCELMSESVFSVISNLKYTKAPKRYAISDNFSIITTWGKLSSLNTIKGFIKYVNNRPVYYVKYGSNFELEVVSDYSSSDTATKAQAINELNEELKVIHARTFAKNIKENFNQIAKENYHPIDTGILHPSQPVINIQISGDGHNISRKPLVTELNELQKTGFVDNNRINWNINLYFFSDWKFLALSNSVNFCPWCQCKKTDFGNLKKQSWKIEKDINLIASNHLVYPGHIRAPLFSIIPLNHWVPDELHIMLRITDQLWSLLISELEQNGEFDDNICKTICNEMKK